MYSKSITRSSRALFVIAIDQSASMAGIIDVDGTQITKAQMVARVANDLISELIERSRRTDGVRDYYDVAIIGYSGDGVQWLLGKPWASIVEIDKCCKEESLTTSLYIEREVKRFSQHYVRRWIEAKASGSTPMYECLLEVRDLLNMWVSEPKNFGSFPPMVYNITDGESTDCDYTDIVDISSQIKDIKTSDGNALLINVHIASSAASKSMIFPTADEFVESQHSSICAMTLYNAASEMPPIFSDAIRCLKGSRSGERFKAMSYNATASQIVSLLNIGSISVKRR